MDSRRLMAVDPSLTCSGWALFCVATKKLLAVGKIRSAGPSYSLAERLRDLQRKIHKVFEDISLSDNDVLVCESQTTMRDPKAAFQVEQVRGIFETLARSRSVPVPGRINPRSVQYEVMGLVGKQASREIVKETALRIVRTVYGDTLREMGFELETDRFRKHQDVVDAILIGTLGLTRIGTAEQASVPLDEILS